MNGWLVIQYLYTLGIWLYYFHAPSKSAAFLGGFCSGLTLFLTLHYWVNRRER